MKETTNDYKAIVIEMAQVLSRHHLNTREAVYASAMMFMGAVENDLEEYSDSEREILCYRVIQGFYASKNNSKSQMN